MCNLVNLYVTHLNIGIVIAIILMVLEEVGPSIAEPHVCAINGVDGQVPDRQITWVVVVHAQQSANTIAALQAVVLVA